MRTLAQIKDYVARQDQSHSEITAVTRDIFTRVSTPQQFVAELQSKRNLTNHQELKKRYNNIIDYANEDDMTKTNWETQETIQWLVNDQSAWDELQGQDAQEIEEWVKQGNAPDGLYKSFRQPPASSFVNVDWEEVADSLAE